jgi:CMP-N-acetylneuraminic acid synthetase
MTNNIEEKSNVVQLRPVVKEPTVKETIEAALAKDLIDVVVIGRTKDEYLYYAASVNGPDFVWLCEKAKLDVLTGEAE